MDSISNVIGTICLSIIVMTMLYNITNFPATEKVIRFVIAMYIILNSAEMITGMDFDFTLEYDFKNTDESIVEEFKEYSIEETEKHIENTLKKRFAENYISYNDVAVHILEQNDILNIDTVVVKSDTADDQQIRKIIEDIISKDTKLIIGE